MKKISISTPCYNEEKNIPELYNRVTKIMQGYQNKYDYDLIFIDNCSTDQSRKELEELAGKDKHVKVIFNSRNFGPDKSSAYGLFQTDGDATIGLACDLQDPPEMIPKFIEKWEEGYQIVLAQKTGAEESHFLYKTRELYYKIIMNLADYPQFINVTGFGLYDREVVRRLSESIDPEPNFRNIIGYYGYKIAYIPFIKPNRKYGKSSYNFSKYFDTALHSLVTTSTKPLKWSLFIGLAIDLISIVTELVFLVVEIFTKWKTHLGYYPMLILIVLIMGIFLFLQGIQNLYISEIYKRKLNKPLVVEEKRINF